MLKIQISLISLFIIFCQPLLAQIEGTQKWAFNMGDWILSSPAIGLDGTIYLGSLNNKLYAINPDGTEKWSITTGPIYFSSPTLSLDGTIYVGSSDNNLYSVNSNGTLKWIFNTNGAIMSSPAIDHDGIVYIGSRDSMLYAIFPNGTQKWAFATTHTVESSPAIDHDGTIYVGSRDNKLYAINSDGIQKWAFNTENDIYSSPAIGIDGTIYIGSFDGKLYAINPDGTQKWKFTTNGQIFSSPAVGVDGTIYVGSYDRKIYAINPDGTQKWVFTTGDWVSSSPAIGSDNTIYVGTWDNKVYSINPDGTLKWSFITAKWVRSSPAVDKNGIIYVGSCDNNFYAIYCSSYGLALSSWPKFRQNNMNTGKIPNPIANFEVNINKGIKPFTVQFTDSSFGIITNWHWNFGDGETSSEQNPTHTYEIADTFNVSLTVTGPGGSDTMTREDYIIVLEPPPIANFIADLTYGIRPFTVQFTDSSTGVITDWHWNFGDSETSSEQNPAHTYEIADTFTVSLTVTGPGGSDTMTRENFIIVIEVVNNPIIMSITDVPNDQGKKVLIIWKRSRFDGVVSDTTITKYGIWRRLDNLPMNGLLAETQKHVKNFDEMMINFSNAILGANYLLGAESNSDTSSLDSTTQDIWTFVGSTPACQFDIYSIVAPTLFDSTETGIIWSTFFISAHTENPKVWFASAPDSGYSVDNLFPSVPSDIIATEIESWVELRWNPNTEQDFDYYSIYRNTKANFELTEPFAFTTNATFVDSSVQVGEKYYYKVTATDFSGNESEPSDEVSVLITSVNSILDQPTEYALSQNYPNPFNTDTMIQYQLRKSCIVELTIYNSLGQKIRKLVSSHKSAGHHKVVWDGMDNRKKQVPSGIYLYRLKTGDFVQTRKMLLMQ